MSTLCTLFASGGVIVLVESRIVFSLVGVSTWSFSCMSKFVVDGFLWCFSGSFVWWLFVFCGVFGSLCGGGGRIYRRLLASSEFFS